MASSPPSSDLPPIATLSPSPDSSPRCPRYESTGGWDEEDSDAEFEVDELHSSPTKSPTKPVPVSRTPFPGARKRSLSSSAITPERQAKRPSLCATDAFSGYRADGQLELLVDASSDAAPEADSSSPSRSSSPALHFSSVAGPESEATSFDEAHSASEEDEDLIADELARSDAQEPLGLAFHRPLQYALSDDPWLVVLASGIIESVQGAAAVAVYSEVASRWRTPSDLRSKNFHSAELLRILMRHVPAADLPVKHLVRIRKLAMDYSKQPPELSRLVDDSYTRAWLTPYIREALRIFCVPGDEWRKVKPTDTHFINHLKDRWASEGKLWDVEEGVLGARHAVIPVAALPAGSYQSAHITLPI